MFHLSNGLHFERLPDGGVAITKTNNDKADSGVQFRAETDAAGWASVVASVSVRGDSGEAHADALVAHNRGPKELDTPATGQREGETEGPRSRRREASDDGRTRTSAAGDDE